MGQIEYVGKTSFKDIGTAYFFNILRSGSTVSVTRLADIRQALKNHDMKWIECHAHKDAEQDKLNAYNLNRKIKTVMAEHKGLKHEEIIAGNKSKEEFHRGAIFGLEMAFKMIRQSMQQKNLVLTPIDI